MVTCSSKINPVTNFDKENLIFNFGKEYPVFPNLGILLGFSWDIRDFSFLMIRPSRHIKELGVACVDEDPVPVIMWYSQPHCCSGGGCPPKLRWLNYDIMVWLFIMATTSFHHLTVMPVSQYVRN